MRYAVEATTRAPLLAELPPRGPTADVSLTREEVIRYLEALPSEDLGTLADEVLARLGMPPVAKPAPALVTIAGAIAWTTDSPTFEVVLHAPGPDKLAVITLARRLLGGELGLQEAKKLVESAPVVLREGLPRENAREMADALRGAGANVEVR